MSNVHYDRRPIVAISDRAEDCMVGWHEIWAQIRRRSAENDRFTIALECYPGVLLDPLLASLSEHLPLAMLVRSDAAYRDSSDLREQFATTLSDDPVFGFMHPWSINDYFDIDRLDLQRNQLQQVSGLVIVVGTGAARLIGQPDILLHAGCTRWELQQRQRRHRIGNLGFENADEFPSILYKNAFFLDWRVGDALRHELYRQVDFFLDLDEPETPRMVAGELLRNAVVSTTHRPFRVVPFFDPGPWGGQWMKEHFALPEGPPNYAWCFDCVPEENSVLLSFGTHTFHLPAQVLVQE